MLLGKGKRTEKIVFSSYHCMTLFGTLASCGLGAPLEPAEMRSRINTCLRVPWAQGLIVHRASPQSLKMWQVFNNLSLNRMATNKIHSFRHWGFYTWSGGGFWLLEEALQRGSQGTLNNSASDWPHCCNILEDQGLARDWFLVGAKQIPN